MVSRMKVLWFRNDLRLHDNAIFHQLSANTVNSSILPVYCFDPRHFGVTNFGSRKTARHRGKFLAEAVAELKESMRGLGSDLLVFHAKPEDVLPNLVRGGGVVVARGECASEEQAVEAAVAEALRSVGARLHAFRDYTLFAEEDLPFEILPEPFTSFRNALEGPSGPTAVRPLHPSPGPASLKLPHDISSRQASWGAELGFCRDRLPTWQELVAKGEDNLHRGWGGVASSEPAAALSSTTTAAVAAAATVPEADGRTSSKSTVLSIEQLVAETIAKQEQETNTSELELTEFVGGEARGLARLERYCESGLATWVVCCFVLGVVLCVWCGWVYFLCWLPCRKASKL
jgi:deoxyribodipyrimidine photolyase